mgnify:CR=1 FL=1
MVLKNLRKSTRKNKKYMIDLIDHKTGKKGENYIINDIIKITENIQPMLYQKNIYGNLYIIIL